MVDEDLRKIDENTVEKTKATLLTARRNNLVESNVEYQKLIDENNRILAFMDK
jgi:hypothetical protein